MRMRFAISGHPKKIEVADAASAATGQETKEPAGGTKEPAEKTNDSTKIDASTGG
jgi:two-component system nitrogen regulation sensor histidine kinase NtrY